MSTMTQLGHIDLQCCVADAWKVFIDGLEKSLQMLDADLTEAEQMSTQVTGEWAKAIEHVFDDLNKFIFSISEPRGSSEEYTKKLQMMRRRIHDHYSRFKSVQKARGLS